MLQVLGTQMDLCKRHIKPAIQSNKALPGLRLQSARQSGRQTREQAGRQRLLQGPRSQVWEDHLKEEHAHTVHVELVRVIEAPQNGGQEGCHR